MTLLVLFHALRTCLIKLTKSWSFRGRFDKADIEQPPHKRASMQDFFGIPASTLINNHFIGEMGATDLREGSLWGVG